MLAVHMNSSPVSVPRSPVEGTRYTELQNVGFNSISHLITTSMCMPENMGDSSCSEYGYPVYQYHSESPSPRSPQSGYHEELHIGTILDKDQSRSADEEDDDDDSSVMLDGEDLALLDNVSKSKENEFLERREEPQYQFIVAHAVPLHYPPAHTTYDGVSSPQTHFLSAAVPAVPHYRQTPWVRHPGYNDVILTHPAVRGVFPPTPSPSPSPRHREDRLRTGTMSDMDDDDDEDEDDEYKPYCDSRRGAKKNLLWKFLLWVLENHTDLAQWTDIKRGVFKFVDTARVSRMWGQRKHKKDMTFEKLSRGIRHYYKRGLMERLANTRLVYKFNWEKVPRKYRKA